MELKILLTQAADTHKFYIRFFKVHNIETDCNETDIQNGDCVYVASLKISRRQARAIINKAEMTPTEIVDSVRWERSADDHVV